MILEIYTKITLYHYCLSIINIKCVRIVKNFNGLEAVYNVI